jgi:alginate O-acetyltransferase complex protein AlgJ
VDQLVEYLRAHSTVNVLDLRPALLEARKTAPAYMKTDTHWNNFGAFMAYQELVRTLAKDGFPGLTPLPVESFTQKHVTVPGGDLCRNLGVNLVESNQVGFKPDASLPKIKTSAPPIERPRELAFTWNAAAKDNIVIFQDSFGRAWMPFLAYHFGKVTYVWEYDMLARSIEEEKPVLVINEMLERFFNTTNPAALDANQPWK